MPTRFVHLAVDSAEISVLGRFWADLLDWPILLEDPDEVYLEAPEKDGSAIGIAFVPVPELKTGKNRVHLDLASASPAHQEELVATALDLGARRIDVGQGDKPWVVLADPEGNEFCVLEPRPMFSTTGAVAAVVQSCSDPVALAPFWSAASGWPVFGWKREAALLRPLGDRGPWLALVRTDDVKRVKQRIHLDVRPFAGDDHAADVSRLIDLGARHTDIGQGDVPWVVLADPQGNEFCVLTPRD